MAEAKRAVAVAKVLRPATLEPKGMPLPLLEPKNGAQLLRKAVGPVLEAVLAHVNKGVEPAQQMSLLDMSNKFMGTRQVSIDGTHLHM